MYKLTVDDIVKSNKKSNDDWGVKGYNIPKFNCELDKALNYSFAKGKNKNFIDQETKSKAFVPPAIYNVEGSWIKKSGCSFIKRDRPLFITEQIRLSKNPPVGSYDIDKKQRIVGAAKR